MQLLHINVHLAVKELNLVQTASSMVELSALESFCKGHVEPSFCDMNKYLWEQPGVGNGGFVASCDVTLQL